MIAASRLSLHRVTGNWLGLKASISRTSISQGGFVANAASAIAVAFSTIALVPLCYGDTGKLVAAADAVEADRPQVPASVDAGNMSCTALKDKLASAGSLTILSAPKGWGDTFYGPRVPQCQFWTRPVFSYVRTRDGLCGVGYICVEKFGAAGGR